MDQKGLSASGESAFADGRDGGGDSDFVKIGASGKGGSADAGDCVGDDQGRERRDILKGSGCREDRMPHSLRRMGAS